MWVALPAERAQNETPLAGCSSACDGGTTEGLHLVMSVSLAGELPRVRVISVGRDRWVVDHDALEVETAIAEIQDNVDGILVPQAWRRASKDLSLTQRRDLRYQHLETSPLEVVLDTMDGCVELDGTNYSDCLAGGKVALECRKEMRSVDADVNKDIESLDLGDVDGNQTAVSVMHEQVAPEGTRGVVVYAASTVGDVPHDEGLNTWTKLLEDV